jgi:type II secretory pathway component PulJ
MRNKEHIVDLDFSQRPATLLLVACVVLMAVLLVVTWIYLAAISRDIAIAASNQSESARALIAMSEQQAAANMRLDAVRGETNLNLRAIREQLHTLNEKASVAADVIPPQNTNTQP